MQIRHVSSSRPARRMLASVWNHRPCPRRRSLRFRLHRDLGRVGWWEAPVTVRDGEVIFTGIPGPQLGRSARLPPWQSRRLRSPQHRSPRRRVDEVGDGDLTVLGGMSSA